MADNEEQKSTSALLKQWQIPAVVAVIIVVLLVLVFSDQLSYFLGAAKTTLVAMIEGKDRLPCGCYGDCTCGILLMPDASVEHLSDVVRSAGDASNVEGTPSDVAMALGYGDTADMSWNESIKLTDIDPAVHVNHEGFVADVRRFSSGANFTSVADDNTNAAFTNFVGLRRPQSVDILPDARMQPDIDQDVLKRNKPLIW